jgi:hypothetical protein
MFDLKIDQVFIAALTASAVIGSACRQERQWINSTSERLRRAA